MDLVLEEIRQMAVEIVKESRQPVFYDDYKELIKRSEKFFKTDPFVGKVKNDVFEILEYNLGHGVGHAKKVAVEAGVIYVAEMKKANSSKSEDYLLSIAQTAGILHDICRKQKYHAQKGAEYADYYLPYVIEDAKNIEAIVHAISNHEAFCAHYNEPPSFEASVLSDSLYDSDKFRWGPDNFSFMLWAMIEQTDITAAQFLSGYKKGINALRKIRNTFRTPTGKKYGPEFIDIGIDIGNRLYDRISNEFNIFTG